MNTNTRSTQRGCPLIIIKPHTAHPKFADKNCFAQLLTRRVILSHVLEQCEGLIRATIFTETSRSFMLTLGLLLLHLLLQRILQVHCMDPYPHNVLHFGNWHAAHLISLRWAAAQSHRRQERGRRGKRSELRKAKEVSRRKAHPEAESRFDFDFHMMSS